MMHLETTKTTCNLIDSGKQILKGNSRNVEIKTPMETFETTTEPID